MIPGGPQGTTGDLVLRTGERKALEDAAVIRLDGTCDELGIPDPVRADRCDLDALRGIDKVQYT